MAWSETKISSHDTPSWPQEMEISSQCTSLSGLDIERCLPEPRKTTLSYGNNSFIMNASAKNHSDDVHRKFTLHFKVKGSKHYIFHQPRSEI